MNIFSPLIWPTDFTLKERTNIKIQLKLLVGRYIYCHIQCSVHWCSSYISKSEEMFDILMLLMSKMLGIIRCSKFWFSTTSKSVILFFSYFFIIHFHFVNPSPKKTHCFNMSFSLHFGVVWAVVLSSQCNDNSNFLEFIKFGKKNILWLHTTDNTVT